MGGEAVEFQNGWPSTVACRADGMGRPGTHAWVQWAGTAQAQTILRYVLEGVNGVDAVCL